jgi:hypothetical protein
VSGTAKAVVYDEQFHLDVKRFYAPIRIEGKCPACGATCTHDTNHFPLDYPRFGRELSVGLACRTHNCVHNSEVFYVMVKLGLTAEATSEAMTYDQMVARRSAQ